MSSSQSPDLDDDVHQTWFSENHDLPFPVGVYQDFLLKQFAGGGGAIVGPNDWYLSRAEAYKHNEGLRHERFVAIIKRTPRLPKPSASASHAEDVEPVYLTIERSMDRNHDAEGSSGSGANTPAAQIKEDGKRAHSDASSMSHSSKDSFHGSEFLVKFSRGVKPAHDKVSYSKIFKAGKYVLLGKIEFPTPSAMLPHEEDSDAVFTELSVSSGNNQTQDPSSRTWCTTLPLPFISLPTLISLADTIGKHKPLYTLTRNNCFWYCSMLFFALRRYTSSNIIVPVATKPSIIIEPNDDVDTVKEAFEKAKLAPGHYSIFEIMKIPKDSNIDDLLKIWMPERKKLDNLFHTRRLKYIQAERERVEKARQEGIEEGKERVKKAIEEGEEKAKKARQEGIEEGEKKAKKSNQEGSGSQRQQLLALGWTEEKISSFFKD